MARRAAFRHNLRIAQAKARQQQSGVENKKKREKVGKREQVLDAEMQVNLSRYWFACSRSLADVTDMALALDAARCGGHEQLASIFMDLPSGQVGVAPPQVCHWLRDRSKSMRFRSFPVL